MIEIFVTDEFVKRYKNLPVALQKKSAKQEKLFRENPFHPSLHTEKLNPKNREVWSFRVDKSYRIVFRFTNGKTAMFLTVGPHDWVYKIQW